MGKGGGGGAIMIDVTRTTTNLLAGLRTAGHDPAWAEFDRRYRPVLINFARKLGLPDADAQEAAQDTLSEFARLYADGRYDPSQGRLRMWLIGIAKRQIAATRRRSAAYAAARGESVLSVLPDDDESERLFLAQRREHILAEALTELRRTTSMNEKTIAAFELLVTRKLPPATVAETLGMSTHDVYLAKSRCLAKVREIAQSLESAYEGD